MSGNVVEWCWDWYRKDYHPTNLHDPHGPETGVWRILRGGSVVIDNDVSSGFRHYTDPAYHIYDIGLRLASSDLRVPAIIEAAGL